MLYYIFDNTFEGLLTAIYQAYYRREKPDGLLPRKNLQCSFVDRYMHIETDAAKAAKVYCSIKNKISLQALENVYRVYLSDLLDAGTMIYRYLSLGWQIGRSVDDRLTDDRVLPVHQTCRRVGLEVHRMLGFVRFRAIVGNIYYAPVKPQYNITELLAPHFAERMGSQNWIIHDVGRSTAVICSNGKWMLSDAAADIIPKDEAEEEKYQLLWKQFFESICIVGKKNLQLQKRLMPMRYWDNLTELK